MARYKPQDRNSLLLPVVLSEQIVPGSFAFALDYLVDNELKLTALDAKFKNDEVGASGCATRCFSPTTARSRPVPVPGGGVCFCAGTSSIAHPPPPI